MDETRSETDPPGPGGGGAARSAAPGAGSPARARYARGAAVAAALGTLAACQGYEPRPLDLAAHHDAWRARSLERDVLAPFLERADGGGDDGGFDVADGLSLREGRLVALVYNPGLRLARLRAGRAAAGAAHAGLWRDPQLSANVLRITESVPDPWVITPGLAFTFPLSGRLEAERDLADAELRAAEAAVAEAEWTVARDVAAAWIEWSAGRRSAEETERYVAVLEDLVATAAELAGRGELPRTEAALFGLEQAQRANELVRLRGEAAAGEQRVRTLLGLMPEAPVELLPTLVPPAAGPDGSPVGAAAERIAARHPALARLREEYAAAEQTLRREVREQYPDLTLGPLFETDEGQSRAGIQGWLPLPFLNANRRAIAAARADRELARAAFETEYDRLVGRWAAATARAAALAQQRADLEQELLPRVERQVEDAIELARLGEGSSLVLLESLSRSYRTRLDVVAVRSSEALTRVELAFLLGPHDPRPTEEPTGSGGDRE